MPSKRERLRDGLQGAIPQLASYGRQISSAAVRLDSDAWSDVREDFCGVRSLVQRFLGHRPFEVPYNAEVSHGLHRGSRLDGDAFAGPSREESRRLVDEISKYAGIIDLRAERSFTKALAQAAGTAYCRIPIIDGWHPRLKDVAVFLNFVLSHHERGLTTYVHCQAGMGRTGAMVACQRIALDGWTVERAIDEARGFKRNEPLAPNQENFIRAFDEALRTGKFRIDRLPNGTRRAFVIGPLAGRDR